MLKNFRMEPKYIYLKNIHLDNNNKFDIELTKGNAVEKTRFLKRNNYLLTGLNISPKIEDDLTKCPDYKKIKKLSNKINEIKKKKIL